MDSRNRGDEMEGSPVRHGEPSEHPLSNRTPDGLLEAMLASIPDFVYVFDRDRRFVYVNGAMQRLFGLTAAQMLGRNFADLNYPPGLTQRLNDHIDAVFDTGQAVKGEVFYTSPIGVSAFFNYVWGPVRSKESGAVEWVVGVSRDMTERRHLEARLQQAAEALHESEARLSAIFAHAAVGLSELDLSGRFLRVNEALCSLLGRTPEELLQLSALDVTHPESHKDTREVVERAMHTGGPESLDKQYVRPDGTAVWANSTVTLLRDDAGDPRSLLVATTDLTERRRYESWLLQAKEELEARVAERTTELAGALAALEVALLERSGLLARVVAAQEEERRRISRELHDETGQLLTGLSLNLRALEDTIDDPGKARAVLRDLRTLADAIAKGLHRIAVEMRPTSLDDVGLVPALRTYIEEWSERAGIPTAFEAVGMEECRLPPGLETIVYRVVQEALTNAARYAVPAGATRVSVTLQRAGANFQATIEDDGPGFDPEEAARRGRLGIAGMQERAAMAGGTLDVESARGEGGTTVYLRIPLPATS